MNGELLFLGTGGSMGIPVIGCKCPVCRSSDPKNKRLRPSALLKVEGKTFLIDAGPDLRTQALTHNIAGLDGVILTHFHNDHISGLDDLRVFYMWQKQPIPVLCSNDTAEELKSRFSYIFRPQKDKLIPQIDLKVLSQDREEVEFCRVCFRCTSYYQVGDKVLGFKVGKLAFLTDIRDYEETVFEDMAGAEILVISALRHEPSPVHLSIDQAIAFGEKLGVKKIYLTHMAHEVDHEAVGRMLPQHVKLAYDGLQVSLL